MLRYIREIEFQTICNYIEKGSSVLDLGCGSGDGYDLLMNVTAKDVGRLISSDQVLSAKVLKLVNSPFYGFPGRISSSFLPTKYPDDSSS